MTKFEQEVIKKGIKKTHIMRATGLSHPTVRKYIKRPGDFSLNHLKEISLLMNMNIEELINLIIKKQKK